MVEDQSILYGVVLPRFFCAPGLFYAFRSPQQRTLGLIYYGADYGLPSSVHSVLSLSYSWLWANGAQLGSLSATFVLPFMIPIYLNGQ